MSNLALLISNCVQFSSAAGSEIKGKNYYFENYKFQCFVTVVRHGSNHRVLSCYSLQICVLNRLQSILIALGNNYH